MKTTAVFTAAILLASPAAYPFAHLWDIQEVYSNADGSMQFVEFFTTGPSEQFLTQALMQFQINGTGVNTFDFPSDLSGSTANKTFLAATASFATLYGITPDYIIPANFLSGGAGRTLEFGLAFDEVSLAALPTDGVMSLNGIPGNDAPTATSINAQATARNFAGQQVTIPEPAVAHLVMLGAVGMFAGLRLRRP